MDIELTDMDYMIMFVEEKYGTGAVMEMMDFIEDKKDENEEESVMETKRYVVKDNAWGIPTYIKCWDENFETGNLEGLELVSDKDRAYKFLCKCNAQKFIEDNGIVSHCEIVEVMGG